MKFLVTGGAGFIGSHLVENLNAAGHAVTVIDDLNTFYDPGIKEDNLSSIPGSISFRHVDIRKASDVDAVFEEEKFDAVVHLAARAGVRPSISNPLLYIDTNVTGTYHVLDASRRSGVKKFIFASSSSVYGLCKTVPFREDVPLHQTISPYASTKIAGEQLCSNFSHLYGMQVVCLRFFTVYGPRQRPDLAIHSFTNKIFNDIPIDQFGDGSTRRDYTYVDDIVQGILASMEYNATPFEIFNLGESETTELSQLIRAIESALGKKAQINILPEQPGDVPLTYADISKARKLLGYQPTTKISEGIPKFVDWYLSRQPALQ